MVKRQIVRIDEELCNGCGLCVTPCAEGAIEIVDGKADGAGFCLAVCPPGPLSVEERAAVPLNEVAAERKMHERGKIYLAQTCFQCGGSEEQRVLLPCRRDGASLWVCTRCLPVLIHA
jgi:Fe-S-cluster-containing hydrogenase component 2